MAGDLTWCGEGAPGVVVVHGRGSTRVNHADYCRRLAGAGISALAIDLRGHGDSEGAVGAGMQHDVPAALDELITRGAGALGIRGSSLGGFLALHAADHPAVRAVAALCPAHDLRLVAKYPEYAWAAGMDLRPTLRDDGVARGYWHARGDEIVPWQLTVDLYQRTHQPRHLHVAMGGDHRSLQHDPAIQDATIAWLAANLTR